MKKLITLFTLSFALLTGCGTLTLSQTSDIRTTVRLATVLYINDDQEKAEDVLFVVEETRRDLNSLLPPDKLVLIGNVLDWVEDAVIRVQYAQENY